MVWLESSMNIDHCILRSQYNIFGDEIVVTDDPHLHLVRYDNKIYIQPLPPCLTNHSFFEQYIIPSTDKFKPLALGFLYSYTQLIQHKSGFRIAREKGLLDEKVTWSKWQHFKLSLDSKSHLWEKHLRYRYGELRLIDLNSTPWHSTYYNMGRKSLKTRLIGFYTVLATFFTFYTFGLVAFQVATGPTSPDANTALVGVAYWYSTFS